MRVFVSAFLVVVIGAAACSSSSSSSGAPSESTGDASADVEASLVCGTADAAGILCHFGDACNCNDVGFAPLVCVGGEFGCAPGSTRSEDCLGVPPIRPCTLDDAGVAHGGPQPDAGDSG